MRDLLIYFNNFGRYRERSFTSCLTHKIMDSNFYKNNKISINTFAILLIHNIN